MGFHLFSYRRAITRVQAIAVIVVIVIAAVGGLWYYTTSAPDTDPAPFSMEVISRPNVPVEAEENIMAIAGQRVVFLVVVDDTGEGSGYGKAVDISATVFGAATTGKVAVTVYNPAIKSGEVAEVTVIPDQASTNKVLSLIIQGQRGGLEQTEAIAVEVVEPFVPGMEDELGALAAEMRDKFIPWLAANHPEFGIASETEWIGTIVNPNIIVVMHYIFYSEDWEMYLVWHVTIQPHDWTRVYLRPRFTETQASYAFEISSVQGQEQPQSIELPDWV